MATAQKPKTPQWKGHGPDPVTLLAKRIKADGVDTAVDGMYNDISTWNRRYDAAHKAGYDDERFQQWSTGGGVLNTIGRMGLSALPTIQAVMEDNPVARFLGVGSEAAGHSFLGVNAPVETTTGNARADMAAQTLGNVLGTIGAFSQAGTGVSAGAQALGRALPGAAGLTSMAPQVAQRLAHGVATQAFMDAQRYAGGNHITPQDFARNAAFLGAAEAGGALAGAIPAVKAMAPMAQAAARGLGAGAAGAGMAVATAPNGQRMQALKEQAPQVVAGAVQDVITHGLASRAAQANENIPLPAKAGKAPMLLRETASKVARDHGIPEHIFQNLITAESSWNPKAVSNKGAFGLTQMMPGTAKEMGYDPAQLARNPRLQMVAGAKYLKRMYDMFGTWEKALAAYNAGPVNVARERIPGETHAYVRKVMSDIPLPDESGAFTPSYMEDDQATFPGNARGPVGVPDERVAFPRPFGPNGPRERSWVPERYGPSGRPREALTVTGPPDGHVFPREDSGPMKPSSVLGEPVTRTVRGLTVRFQSPEDARIFDIGVTRRVPKELSSVPNIRRDAARYANEALTVASRGEQVVHRFGEAPFNSEKEASRVIGPAAEEPVTSPTRDEWMAGRPVATVGPGPDRVTTVPGRPEGWRETPQLPVNPGTRVRWNKNGNEATVTGYRDGRVLLDNGRKVDVGVLTVGLRKGHVSIVEPTGYLQAPETRPISEAPVTQPAPEETILEAPVVPQRLPRRVIKAREKGMAVDATRQAVESRGNLVQGAIDEIAVTSPEGSMGIVKTGVPTVDTAIGMVGDYRSRNEVKGTGNTEKATTSTRGPQTIAASVRQKMGEARDKLVEGFTYEASIAHHPVAVEQVRRMGGIRSDAREMRVKAMDAIKSPLSNPKENHIFNRLVIVRDLQESIKRGEDVPMGLTAADLQAEESRLRSTLSSGEASRVDTALANHARIVKATWAEAQRRGLVDPNDPGRDHYFPHKVLDYVKNTKRGYLKKREGSTRLIDTDYDKIMGAHLEQVFADNAIDDARRAIAKHWDVLGKLTPQQVQALGDLKADRVYDIPGQDEQHMLMSFQNGGSVDHALVPRSIAERLKEYTTKERTNIFEDIMRGYTRGWKASVLGPTGAGVKYLRDNTIGDTEMLLREDPGAGKKLGIAAKLAYQIATGKVEQRYQPIVEELKKARVLESGFVSTDGVPVSSKLKQLNPMRYGLTKMAGGYQRFVQGRENVARIAKFLADHERVQRGELPKMKSQSAQELAAAGMDPMTIAGKFARDAVIDYGANGPVVESAKRSTLPFAGFTAQNIAKTAKMIKRSPLASSASILAPLLTAYAFNNSGDRKEIEDSLPDYERKKPHIITGKKDDNGNPEIIPIPLASSQALGFFGIDNDTWERFHDVARGDKKAMEAFKEQLGAVGRAPVDSLYGMLNPLIKAVPEHLFGKKYFDGEVSDIVPERLQGTNQGAAMKRDYTLKNVVAPYSQYSRARQNYEEESKGEAMRKTFRADNLLTKTVNTNSEAISRFYDRLDELDAKKKQVGADAEEGNQTAMDPNDEAELAYLQRVQRQFFPGDLWATRRALVAEGRKKEADTMMAKAATIAREALKGSVPVKQPRTRRRRTAQRRKAQWFDSYGAGE